MDYQKQHLYPSANALGEELFLSLAGQPSMCDHGQECMIGNDESSVTRVDA